MQCEQFLSLLDDWKNGTLASAQVQEVKEHLHTCPRCQTLIKMQEDLPLLFADEAVPAAFTDSWHAALHKEHAARSKRIRHDWIAAAAALLFTAGGALVTGRLAGREAPAPMYKSTAADTSGIMLARAMPEPEPTLWEQALDVLSRAGDWIPDIWPGLVLLMIGAGIALWRILHHISLKKKG
ncbi:MAG: zf-HC2 domain-containing protein [Clostridiales bacterium]|nr:zf-HC2 domain-containing protein [Clostridiales bacterium]